MAIRALTAIATVLALSALAGCGGSDDSSPSSSAPATTPTAAAAPAASAGRVSIASFKYAPVTLTVKAGSRVTFTNRDSAEHTATSDMSGAFDTGALQQGDSKPVSLTRPGRYAYHCDFHPFMHGVVVVR
jgi:plastocyanin